MNNELDFFDSDFDLFDPFKDDFFHRGLAFNGARDLLKCDIVENDNNYELIMDVPGLKREDIQIDHEDGYLTISVNKDRESEHSKKHFIRKERSSYSAKRSFYIGEIEVKHLKARLDNGELYITIPKEKEKIINKQRISID